MFTFYFIMCSHVLKLYDSYKIMYYNIIIFFYKKVLHFLLKCSYILFSCWNWWIIIFVSNILIDINYLCFKYDLNTYFILIYTFSIMCELCTHVFNCEIYIQDFKIQIRFYECFYIDFFLFLLLFIFYPSINCLKPTCWECSNISRL